MGQVSVKEMRANLRALLERVEIGEEIAIFRRGRQVARLVPAEHGFKQFPDLSAFRTSIEIKGGPLSQTVIRERRTARY